MNIAILERKDIEQACIIDLYRANEWSSAAKPDELYKALLNSHSLISAWDNDKLVVYYPHLLIHPDYQGKGIGQMIMKKMKEKYANFHMQMLTADGKAIDFYKKVGFKKAGQTESMWIYDRDEH